MKKTWKHNLIRRAIYYSAVNIFRLLRKIMKTIYRYDNWHCFCFYDKPYAADIVKFCNNTTNKEFALEIGCGLGDIIRRLKYTRKIGWDISQEVLKAAKMFSRFQLSKVDFMKADFLNDTPEGIFNVIICVNWIHVIAPDVLKGKLHQLFCNNLDECGYLVIDTVQDKSYKFNHDINFLTTGLNCEIEKIGKYAFMREVFIIKKCIEKK